VESYTIPATDKERPYSAAEESSHLVGLTTWPPTSEIYEVISDEQQPLKSKS
jgi:hypothetical protein